MVYSLIYAIGFSTLCLIFHVNSNWFTISSTYSIIGYIRTRFYLPILPNFLETKRSLLEGDVLIQNEISTEANNAEATEESQNLFKSYRSKPLRNRTYTSESMKPSALVKCDNQTRCIQPRLQLTRSFNVYYCKHIGYGVRFYYLVREGLLLHPRINLVSTPEKADIVVYLPVSADWEKSECSQPSLRNKTLVLDEGDWPQLFEPPNPTKQPWALYFKRSYVHRQNGQFQGYMGYVNREDVLPMTYTILEAYVRPVFTTVVERDIDIVCTLRGGGGDPARDRVRRWVEDYGKERKLKKYIAGEVNHMSRTVVSTQYLTDMYKAKVVVTVNPSGWEGDFRLMEAMATGALIMVDYMFVPRPYPLLHEQHVIYYDNTNRTDLFLKLDRYLAQQALARRVAINGYIHSMRYHRAANLIDYAFRTLHIKQTIGPPSSQANKLLPQAPSKSSQPSYTFTGYDMRKLAIEANQVYIKQKQAKQTKEKKQQPK